MENYRKLSCNYHQIPSWSVLLSYQTKMKLKVNRIKQMDGYTFFFFEKRRGKYEPYVHNNAFIWIHVHFTVVKFANLFFFSMQGSKNSFILFFTVFFLIPNFSGIQWGFDNFASSTAFSIQINCFSLNALSCWHGHFDVCPSVNNNNAMFFACQW